MTIPVPGAAQVKDLLGMLFDGLNAKPAAAKLAIVGPAPCFVGVYVTDDGAPAAFVACDIGFAAGSGAALSMLPPDAAKEAIKARALTPAMIDNLREVMNICTRLVLKEGSPHLRLHQVVPARELPPAVAAMITAAKSRADFEVSLGRYGSGALAALG